MPFHFRRRAIAAGLCLTATTLQAQDQQSPTDFQLTVTLPLDVSDLTEDVFGLEVGCLAYSSLMQDDANIVGTGRIVLVDGTRPADELTAFVALFSDATIYSNLIRLDFEAPPDKTFVILNDVPEGLLQGWTHGECNLGIYFGDMRKSSTFGGTPADCASTPQNEPVARCIFPGSESVSKITFSREGFDTDGQLLSLPGVDQ